MITDSASADREMLAAFESCTIPNDHWNHRAHVRVAFLYTCQHDLEAAVDRMRSGIQRLNTAYGVPDELDRGYNETITVAFLRLIQATFQREAYGGWQDFCDGNPELMAKTALAKHYSQERLMSWEAKARFVEPDLEPLPE